MNKALDARGMACPMPVVKATQALAGMTEGVLEVRVDNAVAVENLKRMADQKGLRVEAKQAGEKDFVVTISVSGPVEAGTEEIECVSCAPADGNFVVAVDTDIMGRGSEELGKTLMKGFLFALSQLEVLPKTVLFYNGGARLTVEGSDSLEDLKNMAAQGVEILTCGTCLNYYGLTEKLAVGSVTNMYTIVEKLAQAGKVIKP
ncbi:MAG: sulfurtransferase-like selenium metabolism protein YedF [Clostridiales bacterium]|nr:sulfurtransferase-like selenium metabolism protein YedF [Candidatus Cacconaster stercorequi]